MPNETIIKPGLDIEDLKSRIYIVRGQQVMLDRDLAELYGVETKVLNQAVKRNLDRFPEDFRFQLNRLEVHSLMSQIVVVTDLKSQFVTSSQDDTNMKSQFATSSWGGIRKLPYVFTELGVAMLSSVLRSEPARWSLPPTSTPAPPARGCYCSPASTKWSSTPRMPLHTIKFKPNVLSSKAARQPRYSFDPNE